MGLALADYKSFYEGSPWSTINSVDRGLASSPAADNSIADQGQASIGGGMAEVVGVVAIPAAG